MDQPLRFGIFLAPFHAVDEKVSYKQAKQVAADKHRQARAKKPGR